MSGDIMRHIYSNAMILFFCYDKLISKSYWIQNSKTKESVFYKLPNQFRVFYSPYSAYLSTLGYS